MLSPDEPRPCECECAGWCERHQLNKTEHWHHLCQTNAGFRRQWDEGRGPGQRKGRLKGKQPTVGWGDRLTNALKAMGITEDRYKSVKEMFGLPPTCGCAQRREWLNRVGRWWNGEE